jgi:ribosomal protein S18 acetylase RimI-like enzyme
LPTRPSVSEANKKTRKRVRAKKNAMRAKELRQAARAQGTPTRQFGMKTPAFLLKEQAKADRQTAKKIKADRAKAEQERWDNLSTVQKALEGGVVGLVDRKASNKGRQLLYGTKNPSALEVAIAAAPIPAYKAGKVAQLALRGERALKTAKRAEEAVRVGKDLKTARKAEREAAQGTKATAAQMGKQARKRLSKVEAKAAAKRQAAKTADRTLSAATSPVVAAASASPSDVGKRTRAFIEGSATANPIKSTKTTLEAVPGLFTAGASVVGAAYRSAKTGNPDYITGAAKAIGEGAVDVLKPYVSGDADKVRKATEEGAGYILAPLAPRGAISRPAKFVRGKVRKGAERAVSPATTRLKVRRAATGQMAPGKLQRAAQKVTGAKKRKDVAVVFARQRGPEIRKAQEDVAAIDAIARKTKGARGLRNTHGPEAGGAAAILARHGIGRKGTLGRLDEVTRHTNNPHNEMVNLTNTAEWLRRNPDVLKDDRFWDTVAEFRKRTEPLETTRRAKFAAQGDIAGVTRPEHAVPIKARAFTNARTREGAFKDLKRKRKDAQTATQEARLLRARASEAKGPRRSTKTLRAQRTIPPEIGRAADAPPPKANPRDVPAFDTRDLAKERGKPGITIEDPLGLDLPGQKIVVYRNAQGEPVGLFHLFMDKAGNVEHSSIVVRPDMRRQGIAGKMALAAYDAGYPIQHIGGQEAFSAEGAALRRGMLGKGDKLPPYETTLTRVRRGRKQTLRRQAAGKQAEAKRLDAEAKPLADALRPFRAKNTWDKALIDEYVDKVRAKRHPDLEDPIWLSEKPIKQSPEVPGGGTLPLVVHTNTGAARKADTIDRSLPAIYRNTIIDPHIARATSRAIREVITRFKKTVNGRHVFKGPELVRLAQEGKIDLTQVKAVPARWWKTPTRDEVFDPIKLHGDSSEMLRTELADLKHAKGTDYILLDNVHASELVDQLQPAAGAMEKTFSTIAGVGSRIVLYSPAWVAAQFVNEGSQLLAGAGVRGTAGAVGDMVNLYLKDREGYNAVLRVSGDPSPTAHPIAPRTQASASEYLDISEAGRIIRKTPVGRFLYEAAYLRTFSNIDRWKSTRIRAIAKLASENKEFGRFSKGLGGMLREMDEVSAKLAKMPRAERHAFISKNPQIERRILDNVDDMMGNWEAFTSLERRWGPLATFYPYLRMSLKWTFQTFPKGHPIKAQIFYLLAQQNRDQLEKLLGSEPSFIQGAYPVLYDTEGKGDAILPGGARFGAPGSNVLVESMGEGNVIGALRLLTPALSTPLFAVTGLNPFTGNQDVKPGSPEWGMHALATLLSTFPPARVTGLSQLGEKSDAAKAFDQLDPHRALRSFLNPFQPLSGERARKQQTLSDALEAVSNDPEYGDLVDAILAKDSARVRELAKAVDLADDARKVLGEFLPSSKAEDKAVSKAGDIIREGTKALKGGSVPSGGGTPSWMGGSSAGGSSKPAWMGG